MALGATSRFPSVHEAELLGDSPYYVMDLLDGMNLEEYVGAYGPLESPNEIADLLVATSLGIAELHSLHVIHRDIAPTNIMMSSQGAMLIDPGVGKYLSSQSTPTFATPGKASYVSPERLEGHDGTETADVYSWGLAMAYSLTARTMFGEGNTHQILAKAIAWQLDTTFQLSLAAVESRSDWHAAVVQLIRACISRNPNERPIDSRDVFAVACALQSPGAQRFAQGTGNFNSLNRVLARTTMKNVEMNLRHLMFKDLDGLMDEWTERLLRLPPTASLLRGGVSANVLYGALMVPRGFSGWHERYRRPGWWISELRGRGRTVNVSAQGLLVFE
jgi:serine/threonine protein kinase